MSKYERYTGNVRGKGCFLGWLLFILKPKPEAYKPKVTPGPFDPREQGPIVGQVVIKKGSRFYRGGTVPRIAKKDKKYPPPTDPGEIGTRYN